MFFLNDSGNMEGCDFFHMTEDAFHELSIEDKAAYEACHAISGNRLSDLCFVSRLAWNPGFGYRVAMVADAFCMVSDGGVFCRPHLAMPLGVVDAGHLGRVMDEIVPLFEDKGWPMAVMYVEESHLPLFEALRAQGYDTEASFSQDYSDYIYNGDSMRTLSGKALHAKRNHLTRFARDYPDHRYDPVCAADGPECLGLVHNWCREKEFDLNDLNVCDYVPIRVVFEHFDRLDVRGGVIRIGGAIRAFALGCTLEDGTAVIHFEKADPAYQGLYAAINNQVLCREFPDALLVNREEDMGIEGLRKAKQSYQPVSFADKYTVMVRRTG